MRLYVYLFVLAFALTGCQTMLDILNALPSPTPVTVTCDEIDMKPDGNYCGGILCDVNTQKCGATGCECTTSGTITTHQERHHGDHD